MELVVSCKPFNRMLAFFLKVTQWGGRALVRGTPSSFGPSTSKEMRSLHHLPCQASVAVGFTRSGNCSRAILFRQGLPASGFPGMFTTIIDFSWAIPHPSPAPFPSPNTMFSSRQGLWFLVLLNICAHLFAFATDRR